MLPPGAVLCTPPFCAVASEVVAEIADGANGVVVGACAVDWVGADAVRVPFVPFAAELLAFC